MLSCTSYAVQRDLGLIYDGGDAVGRADPRGLQPGLWPGLDWAAGRASQAAWLLRLGIRESNARAQRADDRGLADVGHTDGAVVHADAERLVRDLRDHARDHEPCVRRARPR